MKLAGREVRILDPWLLSLWSVPLAIGGAHFFPPVFPFQPGPYARGNFGFPFAFGEEGGASSWENVISVVPMAIDILLLFLLGHAIAVALSARFPMFRFAAIPVGILAWFWVLACGLFIWNYTWALNWWTLGAADYTTRWGLF